MAYKNQMYRRPYVAFTLERKEQFLANYRASGLKYRSAELVGVSVTTLEEHIKLDPEFAAAVHEAKQAWIDETLISAAVKRATKGVKKPVVGGKDRDIIVTYERVYSDGLLVALLKASRPEFRDKDADGPGSGSGGGTLIVPVGPSTVSDWEQNFGELAKGTFGRPGGLH